MVMFNILCYSLIAIILKPTNIFALSSVEFLEDILNLTSDTVQLSQSELASSVESSQENKRDIIKDFAEDVVEYSGNVGYERTKLANDVFEAKHVPMTESSSITALPQQDERNADLEQELLSQNHESEFKESSEADLNHSSITTEQKPTHQIDIREKSEFYRSSGNGFASLTPEDADQGKQKADKDNFHSPDSEAMLVGVNQLIGLEEKLELNQDFGNIHVSHTLDNVCHYTQIVDEDNFQPSDSERTQVSESKLIGHEEKSEFYQSYENELASIAPEDSYQEKQRVDEDNLQPSNSEATQVSESQLLEPDETLSYHDRTERSFTEIIEEARLNPTGESLIHEAESTVDSISLGQAGTNSDINEKSFLAETRHNFTRDTVDMTELKLKEQAEAEDDFNLNEENHLNQIGENNIRESASNIESNSTKSEFENSFKPIFQNENSYTIKDAIKKSIGRDENENFHPFNSPVTTINQDNIDELKNRPSDHVSNLNSVGESELALEFLQRTNNDSKKNLSNKFESLNSEALPEERDAVKENFIPSNNVNADGISEYSESLIVRKIDSEHPPSNSSFPSENDKPAEKSKHRYTTHTINYQSEPDILIHNSIEQLTAVNSHGLINSSEVKTNERNLKEFVTCKTEDCLETTVDHESVDINSKLCPNIQKEDRIGDVDSDLESTADCKASRNDSAHEEIQSTFEYLENLQFDLQEVIHVIKTDRNVRASILNISILYIPVLICDALLWIVIVKLVRHIHRQIISNKQPEPTESLDAHENESEDVDRPISARLTPHNRSRRSERDDCSEKDAGDVDFLSSSFEFLCIN